MNSRTLIGRVLSPGGFLLALVLFVLPLLTMSCSADGSGESGVNGSISASPTGIDIVFDRPVSVTIEQDGNKVTIDPSELEEGAGEDSAEEPTPWSIRGPVIGAAGVIVVGALLALVPAAGIRRLLSAIAALVAAAALAYVVYVSAPNEVEEAQPAELEPGMSFGVDPAIGFWAIGGVLLAVALLQLIPARGAPGTAPPNGTPT